ncbi:MAG: hypothetical protein WCX48_05925 [Bacteroidales bacterium]
MKTNLSISAVVISSLLLIVTVSCKKEPLKVIPTLSTTAATNITSTTATSGGTITNDGGAPVTSHGVCWSTNQYPTIDSDKTSDASGVGSFISSITGLTPGGIYYVRAYATNSVGTAYGNEISFTTVKKFEIIDIKLSSSKIIIGQRVILNAVLSDSTGNIYYEWKLFYNGLQVGTAFSGLDFKKVKTNPSKTGEYTVQLTITRGEYDRSTFEKKFISNDSNFQYGVWGDNEETIKTAESDNGYELHSGLIGIPTVTNRDGVKTTLTYEKSTNTHFTYYFNNGKLYAGAYTKTWWYVDEHTDLRSALYLYYTERGNLNKILNTTLPEGKIWHTPDNSTQIAYWDQNDITRSEALIWRYLEFKAEGTTSVGRGSIYLYWSYSSTILFGYILESPN